MVDDVDGADEGKPADIRSFVDEIVEIEQRLYDLNRDKSAIYKRATRAGFDKASIRLIVRRLTNDPEEWREQNETVEADWVAYVKSCNEADAQERAVGEGKA